MIALLEPPALDDELDPLSWLTKLPDSLTAAAAQVGAKAKPDHGSFGTVDTNSGSKSLAAFTVVVDAAPPPQKPAAISAATASPPSASLTVAPRTDGRTNHKSCSATPIAKPMPTSMIVGKASVKPAKPAPTVQKDADDGNYYDPLCDPFFPLENLLATEARAGASCPPNAKAQSSSSSQKVAPPAAPIPAIVGPVHSILHLRREAIVRPPAWRWERASILLRMNLGRSRDNVGLDDIQRFQQLAAQCQSLEHWGLLRTAAPGLFDAWQVFQDDGGLRFQLECRILARESPASISEKLGLTVSAITWYSAVFFHVGDCIDNKGWIVHCAIGIKGGSCLTEPEAIKLLCFNGGKHVADDLFDTLDNRPRSAEEVGAFYRDEARRTLATKAMLATRMISLDDPKNMIAVMKNWQRLQLAESRQRRNQLPQPDIMPNLKFMFNRIEATLGSAGPPATNQPIAGAGKKE